jgi:DNA-binding transcriptional regulator LsrR (DeoR family)
MNKKTGEEIAQELGISRQAVSNTLKRGMEKLFLEFKRKNRLNDDFEVAVLVLDYLDVLDGDVSSVKKDFNLFPPKIKDRIKKAAEKHKRYIEEDSESLEDLNEFFA